MSNVPPGMNLPPGEQIVSQAVVNGTTVYLTNLGGIYAPEGNYFGSYLDDRAIAPEHRNDPNRRFNRIEATPSGYAIYSTSGERYDFYSDFPQRVAQQEGGAPPGPAPAPGAPTPQQRDARERIKQLLDDYGLGGLEGLAWEMITQDAPEAEIWRRIRETNEYKTRFAGLIQRQENGFAPMLEAEYIQYENAAAQLMRSAGLPEGFYDDPSDFANLIGQNVGLTELRDRIVDGYQLVMGADPEVRRQLNQLYGVSDGELAAFFLDPDRAQPILERRVTAARIAARGVSTGFGQLSTAEAEELAGLGVSEGQAAEGFNLLAQSRELFQALPGEQASEIGRDDQLGAVFRGDAQAQERLSRRQRARRAEFQGGGGFATTSQGAIGLGTAAS